MIDYIFSNKNNEVYATIDYGKDDNILYYFSGKILENSFPNELIELIEEYNGIVDGMALSLLGEVEYKIYQYDLMLKNAKERLFDLSISEENKIYFFTKYPSGKGFLDRYPN